MKVSDVINFAVTGELRPLGVADIDNANADRSSNINSLMSYINQGVIELYKRFGLSTKEQVLTSVADGTSYPTTDDFLYAIYAIGDDENEVEVGINDETSDFSIFTNTPFSILLKYDEEIYSDLTQVTVTYAAAPALVTKETDTVLLPYQFLEALINYMAYKAHSSLIATPQGDNNTYYRRFEASCARLINDGIINLDNGTNNKLNQKGLP